MLVTTEDSFPEIGTVENPAVLFDGTHVFVCYEASTRSGGGNVILKFAEVIDFRIAPTTSEGLSAYRYPAKPWAFNKIEGTAETARWPTLKPTFWAISFNDVMLEIVFETVSLICHRADTEPPSKTLVATLHSLAD